MAARHLLCDGYLHLSAVGWVLLLDDLHSEFGKGAACHRHQLRSEHTGWWFRRQQRTGVVAAARI